MSDDAAVVGTVMGEERLLIDGELRAARSGQVFETVNPATGAVLGVAADGGAADLDEAIGAARRAFDGTDWSTDVEQRVRGLRQLQAAFERHADEIRAMTVAETGSPLSLTYSAQLDTPVGSLGWVADLAEGYEWETDLGNAEPLGIPSHRWVRREATGVIGAITPWNVPHQINLAKLGPALAAGNTVVLKPAPDTPWCATVLGRLVTEETDIPAGVVNIVPSSDHAIGAMLSTDPRVDQVSFTGATATGRTVRASAADTVKKVFLELGGRGHDLAAGGRRPGEADLIDPGIGRQHRPDGMVGGRDDVDHPGGDVGLLGDQPAEDGGAPRGVRGRLEHHRVAGRQRRAQLGQVDLVGHVPRGDGPDHAGGLPAHPAVGRDTERLGVSEVGLPLVALGQVGHPAERTDRGVELGRVGEGEG